MKLKQFLSILIDTLKKKKLFSVLYLTSTMSIIGTA